MKTGIYNKLITNGEILAKDKEQRKVCDYLHSLTLSIDSIDDELNSNIGRGNNHYSNIKEILEFAKNKNIKININTVVCKENINKIEKVGEFLNNYNIDRWKFLKFMPLRELAIKNRNLFEISDAEFNSFKENKALFKQFNSIKQFDFRQEKDMEEKYILIIENRRYYKNRKWKRCS